MNASDLIILLRKYLARSVHIWLMLNDRSDAEWVEAENCFARAQKSLADVDYKPTKLLRFLLERSGLLREPVKGRIDFIHRTFQEYLAAKQAIDENHIGRLVGNAHLAEWHETVILAAGHGTRSDCDKLVDGLLNLAQKDENLRHRRVLLAVGCLETATNLSREYRERTRNALSKIMPPSDAEEARAVASAGDLAVPYLRFEENAASSSITACVSALGLIGSDDALEALSDYVGIDSKAVTAALFRALADLNALHLMASIEQLDLSSQPFIELPRLTGLRSLRSLDLSRCTRLEDVKALQGLTGLESLNLSGCSGLKDLTPLHSLTGLQTIWGLSLSQWETFPPNHSARRRWRALDPHILGDGHQVAKQT